jgi:hypothetical protein
VPPDASDRCKSGPDWVHEIKHDGYRLIARRNYELLVAGYLVLRLTNAEAVLLCEADMGTIFRPRDGLPC